MHAQFVREMAETTDEKKPRNWLRKADLKVETKTLLCARTGNSNELCEKKSETISHIVSKCEKLAQKEYKRNHDVARIVHWKLCGKYNLKRSENGMNMLQKMLLRMK